MEKRAKKTQGEGGLLPGWTNKFTKQHLETISGLLLQTLRCLVQFCSPISARNASSREAVEDQDDPLEYAGGEFDEDEPVKLVKAARDMKKSTVSV